MNTHWGITQQRKYASYKEVYRLVIDFYKKFGLPALPRLPGEDFQVYIARVSKPPETKPS